MTKALLAGLALGAGILAGCTPADNHAIDQRVQGIRQQARQVASSAQTAATNTTLASKVKAALSLHRGLDAGPIAVDANDGSITLRGDVASKEQAALAEQVARDTNGVTRVENRLTLRVPAK